MQPHEPSAGARPGADAASLTDEQLLAECKVHTFRAGGPGGQHQNVTDSGVRLTHLPTGTVVVSRRSRSQHQNREVALQRLRAKLKEMAEVKPERIPTRPPRSAAETRLEEKKRRSRSKRLRKPPALDED